MNVNQYTVNQARAIIRHTPRLDVVKFFLQHPDARVQQAATQRAARFPKPATPQMPLTPQIPNEVRELARHYDFPESTAMLIFQSRGGDLRYLKRSLAARKGHSKNA